jgi:hypothetical protein
VPKPGEEIEREGVAIRIVDATETQVLSARLTRPHPAGDGAEAGEPVPTETEERAEP